jgi:transcriptional regulator with XRE-family HTH domain
MLALMARAVKNALATPAPTRQNRAERMKKRTAAAQLESWEERIGARIRALREGRNATLDQLATETKLTKGQLSRIENGKVSSPVSTLTRIAAALGVAPGDLFSISVPSARAVLVPKEKRRVIVGRASKLGHTYESLAFDLPFDKDFEPYLMTIEEKKIDPKHNVFRHPGQELLYMLEGAMDYRHGEEVFRLSPGDSLYFDGMISHGPVAVYSPPVRFLSIISNTRS